MGEANEGKASVGYIIAALNNIDTVVQYSIGGKMQ